MQTWRAWLLGMQTGTFELFFLSHALLDLASRLFRLLGYIQIPYLNGPRSSKLCITSKLCQLCSYPSNKQPQRSGKESDRAL